MKSPQKLSNLPPPRRLFKDAAPRNRDIRRDAIKRDIPEIGGKSAPTPRSSPGKAASKPAKLQPGRGAKSKKAKAKPIDKGRREPVLVRCGAEFLARLDAYAKEHEISRPEAMRRAADTTLLGR